MDAKELKNLVFNYKTAHKRGFMDSEITELLKKFPNINMVKFNEALNGVTIMIINGVPITYHTDILKAIKCGIQDRNLKPYEWD